jgi:cell division septal protein FtsQ
MNERIDELLYLIEVEPEQLRVAEFLNAAAVLENLAGKTVSSAKVDDRRVTVTTSDGARYYFYGFLGCERSS